MRDPHVASLRYRLETGHGGFIDPEPVHHELDGFRLTLESDTLQVEMKEHFASVEEARAEVEEFLRAWEIDAALRNEKPKIHFVFEKSEVIDRDPPPPGSPSTLKACTGRLTLAGGVVRFRVHRKAYPDPPRHFRLSPDVETLWCRCQAYLAGEEKLLPMAFTSLTLVEKSGGDRPGAARFYSIDKAVLDKLGELTSARGDATTARKFSHKMTPLSSKEAQWVEAAVKAIICRVGEQVSASSLPQIDMSDLPKL